MRRTAADVAGGVHAGGQHDGVRRVVAAPGHRARLPRSSRYYQKLGRILEEGCFDMMFFDDRLAMPGIYGGSVAEAVRRGARPVKLDLSIVLGAIAGATRSIGLGATYSTTYYAPFHVARTFATLDHLSGGRAGVERRHLGQRQRGPELRRRGAPRPRRALRPRRRVPRGHHRRCGTPGRTTPSSSTGPAAASPIPTKVHELDYHGKWFDVRGPADRAPVAPGPTGAAAGGLVGPGPRLRRPLGRADLHRRPRHRDRPHALRGPEGAHRRARA